MNGFRSLSASPPPVTTSRNSVPDDDDFFGGQLIIPTQPPEAEGEREWKVSRHASYDCDVVFEKHNGSKQGNTFLWC